MSTKITFKLKGIQFLGHNISGMGFWGPTQDFIYIIEYYVIISLGKIINICAGLYDDGSCTHSANEGDNWWMVDFIDNYEIRRVIVHNREEGETGQRLDGAMVITMILFFLCLT